MCRLFWFFEYQCMGRTKSCPWWQSGFFHMVFLIPKTMDRAGCTRRSPAHSRQPTFHASWTYRQWWSWSEVVWWWKWKWQCRGKPMFCISRLWSSAAKCALHPRCLQGFFVPPSGIPWNSKSSFGLSTDDGFHWFGYATPFGGTAAEQNKRWLRIKWATNRTISRPSDDDFVVIANLIGLFSSRFSVPKIMVGSINRLAIIRKLRIDFLR